MQDCVNLVNECPILGISEAQVKMAYTYSKMTVVDEDKDWVNYNKMVLVEFMEFIGRLAYIAKIPE